MSQEDKLQLDYETTAGKKDDNIHQEDNGTLRNSHIVGGNEARTDSSVMISKDSGHDDESDQIDDIRSMKKMIKENRLMIEELTSQVKKLQRQLAVERGVVNEKDAMEMDTNRKEDVANGTGVVEISADSVVVPKDALEVAVNSGEDGENRDSSHLLGIFPVEIWLPILEKVDSNSLESLSNASPFFRDHLLDRRVRFLFPKVWNILAVKYHQSRYAFPMDDNTSSTEMDHPRPRWYCNQCQRHGKIRWYSEMLKLRLVCTDWTNAIDTFYQNRQSSFEPRESYRQVFCTTDWTEDQFSKREDNYRQKHLQFLRHFEQSHGTGSGERSPFLGRKCEIELNHFDNQNVGPELLSLFKKYGQHVWFCTLTIDGSCHAPLSRTTSFRYEILRSFLEAMPNLKEIEIIFQNSDVDNPDQVTDVINRSPLPRLEKLQSLKMEKLPAPILSELISRNNHVSMLDVARVVRCYFQDDRNFDDYDFYTMPMLNLTHLEVTLTVTEFEMIEKSRIAWPVDKLKLHFLRRQDKAFIELPRIFKLLEDKWPTLTQVDLKLSEKRDTDAGEDPILKECAMCRLNLPNVKSFTVTMENLSSLDFILPMKNTLEILDISMSYRVNRQSELFLTVRREQVIQFLGYGEFLLESNIWNIFPKLQKIEFSEMNNLERSYKGDRYMCTRKDWRKEMDLVREAEITKKNVLV